LSGRIPAGGSFKTATRMHESLNLEHILEARRLLYTYCPGDFCDEYLKRISRISKIVARARIEDLSRDSKYEGIDSGVLDIYRRMIEVYSLYISGLLVTIGESIIVRLQAPTPIDGVIVEPGESLPLPPAKAISLILAGIAEPLRETAIKLKDDGKPAGSSKGG